MFELVNFLFCFSKSREICKYNGENHLFLFIKSDLCVSVLFVRFAQTLCIVRKDHNVPEVYPFLS